jgi:hypothetical protein
MHIRFIKKENDKHVLTCTRKDGTVTWMNLDGFFLRHDLLHYSVETSLNYRHGFYGMLANGVSISDFELPKEKRNIVFTDEAVYAEHIVNLIMVENACGKFDDFNQKLHDSLHQANSGLNRITLTAGQMQAIHACYDALIDQWERLSEGKTMSLEF